MEFQTTSNLWNCCVCWMNKLSLWLTVTVSFSEEVPIFIAYLRIPLFRFCVSTSIWPIQVCRQNIVKVYSKHYWEVRLKYFMDEYTYMYYGGLAKVGWPESNPAFCNFSRLAGEPFCNDGSKAKYTMQAQWNLLVTPDLYWKNAEIIRQAI